MLVVVREHGGDLVLSAHEHAAGRVHGLRQSGVGLLLGRVGSHHMLQLVNCYMTPKTIKLIVMYTLHTSVFSWEV